MRRGKCPTLLKKRFPDQVAAECYAAKVNNGTGWTRGRSGGRKFGQMGGTGADRFVVGYPCRCGGWHVKSIRKAKEPS